MTTPNLSSRECVPCKGGIPPLHGAALRDLHSQLAEGWHVIEEHHLEREWKFPDFKQALDFTNQVGAVAEAANHHPDFHLGWGKVKLTLWTHKINGLTESDFIFASKVDELPGGKA